MNVRYSATGAIGLAIALALGVSTPSAAQSKSARARRDSVRSQERIKVSKGEVALPRVDTVMTFRTDTVVMTQVRVDTVTEIRTRVLPPDTVYRLKKHPKPGPWFGGKGFYMGIAGGSGVPTGDFNDFYDGGFQIEVPIGFHAYNSMWGWRLNLAYNNFSGKTLTFINNNATTTIDNSSVNNWAASLDGTMRFPLNRNRNTAFYMVGGMAVNYFTNISGISASGVQVNPLLAGGTITTVTLDDKQTSTKFNLHDGAGMEFGIGWAALYIESRFENSYRPGNDLQWVPILMGFSFR